MRPTQIGSSGSPTMSVPYQCFVRGSLQRTAAIDGLVPSDLVETILSAVEHRCGVPATEAWLSYSGKALCPTQSLESAGISQGATLHLAVRGRGGGCGGSKPPEGADTASSDAVSLLLTSLAKARQHPESMDAAMRREAKQAAQEWLSLLGVLDVEVEGGKAAPEQTGEGSAAPQASPPAELVADAVVAETPPTGPTADAAAAPAASDEGGPTDPTSQPAPAAEGGVAAAAALPHDSVDGYRRTLPGQLMTQLVAGVFKDQLAQKREKEREEKAALRLQKKQEVKARRQQNHAAAKAAQGATCTARQV